MQYIAYLVALTAATWLPLWPMLFPRDHPRYVPPSVVADIPNVTFSGGLV
jgi:hypothetical protein